MQSGSKSPGKIAICIGHSRGDGGALSLGGVNEWNYNRKLGRLVMDDLRERGFDVILVDRYAQAGYGRSMALLAASLKSQQVVVAVELHFNSATNATASGHEWLYWHASVPGRSLAQCLDRRMTETFRENPRRGLKPISKREERGGGFLCSTHCPAVICEPFFGTNQRDWEIASAHRGVLARVIADGIDDWKGEAE